MNTNPNQDFFACIPQAGTVPARLHVLAAHEFFSECETAIDIAETIEENRGSLCDVDMLMAALHHARTAEIDLEEVLDLISALGIFEDM